MNEQHEYNVSYNLEEASRLYHAIKTTIDLSAVQVPLVDTQIDHASALSHDKIYGHRFQATWSRKTANKETTTRPTTILAFILAARSRMTKSKEKGQEKKCGHHCFLTTTVQCCTCSGKITNYNRKLIYSCFHLYVYLIDQRPHSENNLYEKYIDGHGIQQCAKRNQSYCPSCKRN